MTKIRFRKKIEMSESGLPKFRLVNIKKESNYTTRLFHHTFTSDLNKNAPKDLIVMYDIPHTKKKERDWFRRHLKKFNYVMIQRSVWVGPSPLPEEFLHYVKSIGLYDQLKIFKIAKSYTGEGNYI